MKYTENKDKKAFKKLALDNAGKIYPAAMTKKWNAVFAVSAYLDAFVDPKMLQQAVEDLAPRFPSMYVRLKKGFLWDCLVPATDLNVVEKASQSPCRMMEIKKSEKPLFRVVYDKSEIRAEFFHAVTDGTGAFEYLKALVFRYLQLAGKAPFHAAGVRDVAENPMDNEMRDEFLRIYEKGNRCSRADSNAYQLDLKKEENYLSRTEICMPLDRLKSVAKEKYGCTVTQYAAAVYAMALLSVYKSDADGSSKPVKLSVPVNLRRYWQSDTLRNFSSYVTINVTPDGEYTFEKVLELIRRGMAEKISKEKMFKNVCQNVADEKMLIARIVPNAVKKIFMRSAFHMYGEKKYTSTVTSVGYVRLPNEFSDRVRYMTATLGETSLNKINCAVVGYKNTLCVNITSVSADKRVQSYFVDFVRSQGIPTGISTDFAPSDSLKNAAC